MARWPAGGGCAIVRGVQQENTSATRLPQPALAMSWWNWTVFVIVAALAAGIGGVVARLAGFPYHPGQQGVLIQQPYPLAAMALLGMVISVLIGARLGLTLMHPIDSRVGAALGLLALGGFALRGGSMRTVLHASEGAYVYWLLAGELLLLSLLAVGVYVIRFGLGGINNPRPAATKDVPAIMLQAGIFGVLMLILGQSVAKGQAVLSIVVAGMLSTIFTRLLIGRVSVHGWTVPLAMGLLGYLLNAMFAGDVEIAQLSSPAKGLGIAAPLDYAAFGPIGVLLGELLHNADSKAPAQRSAA